MTIGADDSLDELVRTMADHQVKRLPVIDGHRLIGVVTEADVARNAPSDKVSDLVQSCTSRADAPARRGRVLWPARWTGLHPSNRRTGSPAGA